MSSDKCCCSEQIGMASVPKQEWCEPYDLATALKEGTIFPCLNLTFFKAPENESTVKCCSCSEGDAPKQHDRETMMTKLMQISFAINDLTLYLDTHPDCPKGLSLFYDLLELRTKLLAEFASEFNPLTQISMITGKCDRKYFGWTEGPMPWEGACI